MTNLSQEETKPLLRSNSVYYSSLSGTHPVLIETPIVKKKVPYTRIQWLTLVTLAFGNFCVGACVSLQAPFFPKEAEKKGATPTEYGFIFGIYQLTIFIAAPFMGKLVSYVSPKSILNAGILTVGITCIIFGLLDMIDGRVSFVAMAFVVRTVEGIGAAALRTSCYTIIASQFPEGIGTTFATLEMFLGLGLITGPTVGGALYDLGGYGLPFYVVGSIVIVDAFVIFFALPGVEKSRMPEKGNMLRFWMRFEVLVYSLSVFTCFNYIGFNQATLEPHVREFELSGLFLGMLFALSGTIYAIGAPIWGWLSDKKCSCKLLSLLGCAVMIVSLLLIGPAPFFNIATSLELVITSLTLLGVGVGAKLVSAFSGTVQDTMQRDLPQDLSTYGLISSMIASSQSLGAFVGPSLGGYLFDKLGFRNASMALLAVESLLGVLLLFTVFRKSRNPTYLHIIAENGLDRSSIIHTAKENGISNGLIAHVGKDNAISNGSIILPKTEDEIMDNNHFLKRNENGLSNS